MKLKNLLVAVLAIVVVVSCTKPEDVTANFVKAMANGHCDEALELSKGQAKDAVLGALQAGCETYSSEILGKVVCDVEGDIAVCSCTEKRSLPGKTDITFKYTLEKSGTDWKVVSYTKDNDLKTTED